MRVDKSTCEMYSLRNINNEFIDWCDIFIKTYDKSGILIIRTEYECFECFWSNCGKDFKTFLTTLDDEYLMKKISKKVFFSDKWLLSLKEKLNINLKEKYITQNTYNNCVNEYNDLVNNSMLRTSEGLQVHIMENLPYLYSFITDENYPDGDDYPHYVYELMKVWHDFVKELKEEIKK